MNKKHFLLILTTVLCLFTGKAWGNTVSFTQLGSNGQTDSWTDHTKTQDGITFTLGRVKYYYSAAVKIFGAVITPEKNYYYIDDMDAEATISWTNPSDPTKSIVVTSISINGQNKNSGNSMSLYTTFSGEDGKINDFIKGSDNVTNTITINDNSNVMSTYGLVNGQQVTLHNGNGESQIENITITYSIVDAPFPLFQYKSGDDYTAAKTAYEAQYTTTTDYSNNNSNPQWIRNYASRLLSENNIASMSDYTTKISNLAAYSKYTTNPPSSNMTELLANPNFEASTWNYGWTGTGTNNTAAFKIQNNNEGGFDSHFVEMWNSKNNSIDAGDINQTVKLPAGVYKLWADVLSRRMTSTLYASFNSQEVAYNCTNINDTRATKTIIFGFDSETNVQIGYRHGAASSSEGDVWSAVDNFTLNKVNKLELSVTSGIASQAIFVGDSVTNAFTFAYDDNDFTPPTPTSSSSDDFYYTIGSRPSSIIRNPSNTNDVITYDPANNKIKAWNAGTATITFYQKETSTVAPKSISFEVTVNKIANPITVTLDGAERNSKNIGFSTDVSFTYSALSGGAVTITEREGGAGASTLNNEMTKFTSSATIEGVDYWDLSIAETYQYEASSTFVRIQVNAIPETVSYLDSLYKGRDYDIQDNGSIVINLSYSPLEITYQAKRNNAFSSVNAVCTAYNAEDGQVYSKSEGLGTGYATKTHALPETTRKVVLSRSGLLGVPVVKDIYVVRRTYINASVDNADLGKVLVGNTNTATITVDWGTSNGGNITVESDNTHFTVSSSTIEVTANSNGTADITVTYTPAADALGAEQANITFSDRYHSTTVKVQGAAIKNKGLVYGYGLMYNSAKNIQIDDEGTDVYDATYSDNIVTLNKRTAPAGKSIIIPAGEVVLLYKADDKEDEASTINYEHTTGDANISIANDNCFIHHGSSITGNVNYVLAKQDGVVAFYKYTGDESKLENYNVLQLPISPTLAPSAVRIVTEGNTATALVPVYDDQPNNTEVGNGQIYTILGIPVRDMSRPGVYIQNGKKYVVR